MIVGAVVGGAIDAYQQYQNTGTIDAGQVAYSALGGAVITGGVVVAGFAAATVVGGVAAAATGGGVLANAVCSDGDCTNETSSLYRAVSQNELDDILSSNVFSPRPGGGSMEAKWFWENLGSAQVWGSKFSDLKHIVEVNVPTSVIEAGYRLPNLDGLGSAVSFIDDSLVEFNNSIIAINQVIAK